MARTGRRIADRNRTWTHIVVGGGTAGCVLAARLSAQPGVSVLLLEAGGRALHPCLHIPLGLMGLNYRRHSWQYDVEPDGSRGGKREVWPAGRTLGGTSAINGMLWGRGARTDYDAWAARGLNDWGYDALLPYFMASERVAADQAGRGAGGPIRVLQSSCREPLAREFLESALAAGHIANPDYNGGTNLGAAPLQVARGPRLRQSAYSAYLARGRGGANLRVACRAYAHRVIVRDGRAIGVEYEQGHRMRQAHCDGDVILCAGAIGSPALLLRSGIGPAEHISAHGIPVVSNVAGVGGNLRNHPVMALVFEVSEPTLNQQTGLAHLLAEAGRYALGRDSLFSTAPSHVIVYGSAAGTKPDYSITFGAYGVTESGSGAAGRFVRPMDCNAITLRVQLFGSESRGTVRLRSGMPSGKPALRYPALSGSRDVARMTFACQEARRIMQAQPIARLVRRELTPGADVRTDAGWDAALRRLVSAGRHYGGTCAMGVDESSVVDPALRVKGVPNMRVADASVLPELPSSGLYAPTVMLAERAAELIATAQRDRAQRDRAQRDPAQRAAPAIGGPRG